MSLSASTCKNSKHNYLQKCAMPCDNLQKSGMLCDSLQKCAMPCDRLQKCAMLCDSLQKSGMLCDSLQKCAMLCDSLRMLLSWVCVDHISLPQPQLPVSLSASTCENAQLSCVAQYTLLFIVSN